MIAVELSVEREEAGSRSRVHRMQVGTGYGGWVPASARTREGEEGIAWATGLVVSADGPLGMMCGSRGGWRFANRPYADECRRSGEEIGRFSNLPPSTGEGEQRRGMGPRIREDTGRGGWDSYGNEIPRLCCAMLRMTCGWRGRDRLDGEFAV